MDTKNLIFRAAKGNRTTLDKEYTKHINEIIRTYDEEQEGRWETYNVVIEILTEDVYVDVDYIEELKYRLTDGEDPSEIILDFIQREKDNLSGVFWFLKKRIEEYIEEDYFNRFLV